MDSERDGVAGFPALGAGGKAQEVARDFDIFSSCRGTTEVCRDCSPWRDGRSDD
jgi:hypothetical protein